MAFSRIILFSLLLTIVYQCATPNQIQGQCTSCKGGYVNIQGFCHPKILGCLQYQPGPLCVSCQNAYTLQNGKCQRQIKIQGQGPAPLIVDDLRPLELSEIINKKLDENEIIETLNDITNYRNYEEAAQQQVQQNTNIGQEEQPTNQTATAEQKTEQSGDAILSKLFELYPLFKSSSLSYEEKGNGFYVFHYTNKTTFSVYSQNDIFVVNRPMQTQNIFTGFSCEEDGYQSLAKLGNNSYNQVLRYVIDQFSQLEDAPVIEVFHKESEQFNKKDEHFKIIFKKADYFYEITVFRSSSKTKQVLSANRLKLPEVLFSNNYNYNVDPSFFEYYSKLIQVNGGFRRNGILFVTKRKIGASENYKIVYFNADFVEFRVFNGEVELIGYYRKKQQPIIDSFLRQIYSAYPNLADEKVVNQQARDIIYIFSFGNHTTISGIQYSEDKLLLNSPIRQNEPQNVITLNPDIYARTIIELLEFIYKEFPSMKGKSFVGMRYYYQDQASIYFIRMLSFEYEYHIRVSQKIGQGLSLLQIQNFNNFDPSITEVLYSKQHNYNKDMEFFDKYLKVVSNQSLKIESGISGVFKNKSQNTQVYKVQYENGDRLQFRAGKQGVELGEWIAKE